MTTPKIEISLTAAGGATPAAPERRAFDSQGLLAIDPKAFGLVFDMFQPPAEPFVRQGKAAIVCVDGPLQTAGWFCDTYDRVKERVAAALASDAEAVVLRVASPGGDVFGCFDTARALRSMARAAGKPLLGHTSANACSSAYALISAADAISASDSAVLGSIGVIATAVDLTRQNAAMGLNFAIITSGARKSDGNPNVALSDDARAAMQSSVDAMAAVFFGLVKEHRGFDPADLEAATFVGADALRVGLADHIESFDALLERLESQGAGAMLSATQGSSKMPKAEDDKKPEEKKDEARASLAKAAEGGNARAKRALAAYDEDKDEKAEDPKKDAKAEKEPDGDEKAADAPFEKKAEDDKEKEKAIAASAARAATIAANDATATRIAALEASTRRALFAARPDLSAEFVKACVDLPIPALEAVIAAAPRPAPGAVLVPEPSRAPARGLGGVSDPVASSDRSDKATSEFLDAHFGFDEFDAPKVVNDGAVQQFGVIVKKGAR